jgi:hypothetical protein
MASAAHSRWVPALVLLAVTLAIWWTRRRPPRNPVAYIADRTATLWSAAGQVHRRVATLRYGERVAIMSRSRDQVEVRTFNGTHGWLDPGLLLDPGLWQRASEMLARARAMPVQARGHTHTLSNVHIEPGRDAPRIFQFSRNLSVVVLERKVTEARASPGGASGEEAPSPGEEKPGKEDWWLVLRAEPEKATVTSAATSSASVSAEGSEVGQDISIAGWVLARFITLDPPPPIGDYSSSAGLHVVAWAVLNTVSDASGQKAQYVVAGTGRGEGRPCDFTMLRVYTWGAARQRYETAYVESKLCGSLPIRVRQAPAGIEFRFAELDQAHAERVYRMKQTTVRRVYGGEPPEHKGR